MTTRLCVLGSLASLGLFSTAHAAPLHMQTEAAVQQGARETLEQFLARLRRQRDELQGGMRAGVDTILRGMELEAQSRRIEGLQESKTRLVRLGPEIALLIVDRVDPGAASDDAKKLCAQFVTQALLELPTRAITTRLCEIAKGGTSEGRLNALKVLAVNPEPDRVSPVLAEIYRSTQGEQRGAALMAMAKIGGPQNEALLVDALTSTSQDVVKLTLEALGAAHNTALAPKVVKLLANPKEATDHIDGIVAYYRACPEVVDKQHLGALIRLAQEPSAGSEKRIRIVDLLPTFAGSFDADLRRELRTLVDTPSRELRESALVALCVVGDRNARRDLLADYDSQIDHNRNWGNSYEARGNILYRIGDYKEAINDYRKALQLGANDLHARQDQAYIGLARSYMQLGKHKEAAQTLEKAPISLKQLADLAKDPVFAKLVENPKYKALFQLK